MTEITIEESTELAGEQRVCVLRIIGYLDGHTYPEFESQLTALLESGCFNVVIDLDKLSYISSAGLGALLNAHTRAREHGGYLNITGLSEKTQRLFDLLGFSHVLKVYDTIENAVQAFATH